LFVVVFPAIFFLPVPEAQERIAASRWTLRLPRSPNPKTLPHLHSREQGVFFWRIVFQIGENFAVFGAFSRQISIQKKIARFCPKLRQVARNIEGCQIFSTFIFSYRHIWLNNLPEFWLHHKIGGKKKTPVGKYLAHNVFIHWATGKLPI
jgi:hypothetical protein